MKKWVLLLAFFTVSPMTSANTADTNEEVVRRVADYLLENTARTIVNEKTGEIFNTTNGLPVTPEYRVSDILTDWRYSNGVYYLGLMELSDTVGDQKYRNFVHENFDFIFRTLPYFRKQYNAGYKRGSMSQFFRMELLDHCGSMGAALIEVYHDDPRDEYRSYIDKVAHYISEVEIRLKDGSFVRDFPHKLTLWGDDLYMSVPFLARMAVLTGDQRYFDDAARQVFNSTFIAGTMTSRETELLIGAGPTVGS